MTIPEEESLRYKVLHDLDFDLDEEGGGGGASTDPIFYGISVLDEFGGNDTPNFVRGMVAHEDRLLCLLTEEFISFDPLTGTYDDLAVPDDWYSGDYVAVGLVAISDDELLLVGQSDADHTVAKSWCYEIDTDTWETMVTAPSVCRHGGGDVDIADASFFAIAKVDDKVYVGGGVNAATQEPTAVVDVFDIETETWSVGTSMPVAISRLGSCGADGKWWVFGGETAGLTPTAFGAVFTPGTGWTDFTAELPGADPLVNPVVAALADNTIMYGPAESGSLSKSTVEEVYLLDTATPITTDSFTLTVMEPSVVPSPACAVLYMAVWVAACYDAWLNASTFAVATAPVVDDIPVVIGSGDGPSIDLPEGSLALIGLPSGAGQVQLRTANAWAVMPTAVALAAVPHLEWVDYLDHGNTGTDETDLDIHSFSPISVANGGSFRATFAGTFKGHATATRRLKVLIDTTVLDTGALAVAADASWSIDVLVIRVSNTTLRYTITIEVQGADTSLFTKYGESTGNDFSTGGGVALYLKATAAGTGAATDDIVQRMSLCHRWAAA